MILTDWLSIAALGIALIVFIRVLYIQRKLENECNDTHRLGITLRDAIGSAEMRCIRRSNELDDEIIKINHVLDRYNDRLGDNYCKLLAHTERIHILAKRSGVHEKRMIVQMKDLNTVSSESYTRWEKIIVRLDTIEEKSTVSHSLELVKRLNKHDAHLTGLDKQWALLDERAGHHDEHFKVQFDRLEGINQRLDAHTVRLNDQRDGMNMISSTNYNRWGDVVKEQHLTRKKTDDFESRMERLSEDLKKVTITANHLLTR